MIPFEHLFTVKTQRVQEGLDEDEAWRLFHQIVDALVHMSNLGIVGSRPFRVLSVTDIVLDPSRYQADKHLLG